LQCIFSSLILILIMKLGTSHNCIFKIMSMPKTSSDYSMFFFLKV